MFTNSKITGIYDTRDWEENGKNAKILTELRIGQHITITGTHLHYDVSNDDEGLFFVCRQGYIKARDVYVNKDNEICVDVPDEMISCSSQIQLYRMPQEDADIDIVTYEKPVKIQGFLEVYKLMPEDYYWNEGLEEGMKRGKEELIKELESRGIKVPDDLKPRQVIVVKKKIASTDVYKTQIKEITTI